jgi:hypothetical protein
MQSLGTDRTAQFTEPCFDRLQLRLQARLVKRVEKSRTDHGSNAKAIDLIVLLVAASE